MTSPGTSKWRNKLIAHLKIARFDHWVKNVFVLPGIVVAISLDPSKLRPDLVAQTALGLLAVGLIASSNYTINEVLDAPSDAKHPLKRLRPVPSGQVNIPIAYLQWIMLLVAGLILGWWVSSKFDLTLLALWVMGCVYNIPPLRTKDIPYVDVLSEAINNPLRMAAGWYIVGASAIVPASLLVSYWMVGCYFMAIKRFAEFRSIKDAQRSASYRKSFAFYTEERLLISVMFYASNAMLFFGAFLMRYRLELVLSYPLVALVMAAYLALGFREHGPAENPEKLYREPLFVAIVLACTILMGLLLFVNIPQLHEFFAPSRFP